MKIFCLAVAVVFGCAMGMNVHANTSDLETARKQAQELRVLAEKAREEALAELNAANKARKKAERELQELMDKIAKTEDDRKTYIEVMERVNRPVRYKTDNRKGTLYSHFWCTSYEHGNTSGIKCYSNSNF